MRICTMRRMASCLVLALALSFAQQALANEKIYDATLPSTVWVKADLGAGQISFGSGVLVDAKRKWVVTNYHVVEDQTNVHVFFPAREKDEVVAERQYYIINESQLAIAGQVVARDSQKDLAVIELKQVPDNAKAVSLAERSPRAGQNLHVVGNPAGGALWVYTSGTVRSVYNKRWSVGMGNGRTLHLDARVVETDLAINKGDSGGPVVNNQTELVALVSSFQKDQRLVSTCIDINEIRGILKQAEQGVQLAQQGGISGIGGGGDKKDGKTDTTIGKTLDQTVYKDKYEALQGGSYRVKVEQNSPVYVYIDSLIHEFKGLKVRRVWADGKFFDNPPSADVLLNLLKTSSTRKVGAWEIQQLKDGKYAVVFCHRLHVSASPQEMEAAIRFVFEEADDLDQGKLAGVPIQIPKGDFSLVGTWKATSTGPTGNRINWTIIIGDKKDMTLTVDPGTGNVTTLRGTYDINNGQISLVSKGKANNLGKFSNDANSFTIEDGKLKLTFTKDGGAAPPPVAQVNLAGTTWSGTETLQGFGKLSFEFKANGEAVMIDATATVNGKWVQKGNQVTVTFNNCVYTGTINGAAMTGTARLTDGNDGSWTFSLKRQ